MQNNDENNPVWDVYDLYRYARFNVKIYSHKLHKLGLLNKCIDIALAITAPGSALTFIWETEYGDKIKPYVVGFVAIFAFLKPFLGLTEKIRKHEVILSGYRGLDHEMKTFAIQINQDRKYNQNHKIKLLEALYKVGILIQSEEKYKTKHKLKIKLQKEVNRELPANNFFIPKEIAVDKLNKKDSPKTPPPREKPPRKRIYEPVNGNGGSRPGVQPTEPWPRNK